ncbi:MAG: SET domain-containing protein-lysine N-methyltransferase [Candidatus Paceibacterota bacterium]
MTQLTPENSPESVEFLEPSKIRLGLSNIHFRGVFATQDIEAGEIVERCPMVPLAFRSRYHTDPQIWEYLYTQPPCPCNECKNHGFVFHMVLGYGMMYNHQDSPNTKWKFDYHKFVGDVVAERKILAGEEIFVSYGSKYFENRKKIDKDYAKDN